MVDCRILDFQLLRFGSPALDLNFVLFCNMAGKERRAELDSLLSAYYSSFASVLAGASVTVKFTLPQLKQEYQNKNMYGLMMAMMILPNMLMEEKDTANLEEILGGDAEKKGREFHERFLCFVETNEEIRQRARDIFDEMVETKSLN